MKAYSYIRFSSPEQKKGDSLRRQLEAGEKYAKENGLTLDKELSMKDEGLSAFHGVHRKTGALGHFLELIKDGEIEKGSVLIVENLDRLSREKMMEAHSQFMAILQGGISIVTLMDNQKYDADSINANPIQLIISILYSMRANEESEAKSRRLKAVWDHKRIQAANGTAKMTTHCPLWLKLSHDRKKYLLIPEVCRVVEMIYRMKLTGKGKAVISRELNQMDDIWKPPMNKRNKSGGWREDYVQKIFSTPAVIGIFQPKKRDKDDKKIIICEPIPGYYPAAIDEQLYYEVQDLIQRNSQQQGRGGGQTKKAHNLFVHLAKCGNCKHPLHYGNKGSSKYGYLHCDVSRRKVLKEDGETKVPDISIIKMANKVQANAKLNSPKTVSNSPYQCTAKPINYGEVERLIFSNLEELNIVDLLPDKDVTLVRLNDIERQIAAINPQKVECQDRISLSEDTISTTKDKRVRDGLSVKISGLYDKLEQLDKDFERLQAAKKATKAEADLAAKNLNVANSIYKLLNDCKDEPERVVLRLKLRTELQKLIESIEIYPLQADYTPLKEIEDGVIQTMQSKSIDRIKIRFKGSHKNRLLYLKSFIVRD